MYEQQSGRGFTKRDWWPTPGNVLFTLLAIAVYGLTQQSWAELGREGSTVVASTINYQGRLVNGNGVAVTEVVNLEFEIFDSLEGGTREWGPELHPAVAVQNGLFQVSLGSSMVITPAVWDGGERYLQVVVNGETLSPREVIHSTPTTLVAQQALTADVALTVPDGALSSRHIKLTRGMVSATENLDLTTNDQLIPGMEIIINLSTPQTLLINTTVDIQVDGGTGVASLYVNGVAPPYGQVIFENPVNAARGTVGQNYLLNLPVGQHILQIRARKLAGSVTVWEDHTSLMYFTFAQ